MFGKPTLHISRAQLRKAKPENVLRLAHWLNLNVDNMSIRQVIRLVYWRITRPCGRFNSVSAREDYESLWADMSVERENDK